jgi:hypothetical protein
MIPSVVSRTPALRTSTGLLENPEKDKQAWEQSEREMKEVGTEAGTRRKSARSSRLTGNF